MFAAVCRCMIVFMLMPMVMVVMAVIAVMLMLVIEMHIELHTRDSLPLLPSDVKVIPVELELGEFSFELARVHTQINQRANKHVTADTAENIEIKCFHSLGGQFHESRIKSRDSRCSSLRPGD